MCNNDCNNCPRQICDCRPGILKERDKYKQALDEIEINILKYQELTFDKSKTMRENDCIYKILDIINTTKYNK